MEKSKKSKNSKNIFKNVNSSEEAKLRGNEFFISGAYQKAWKLYSKALELKTEDTPKENISIYYSNRATASFNLHNHEDGLKDCILSLEYNFKNFNALYRKSTCLLKLNKIAESEEIALELKNEKPEDIKVIELLDDINKEKEYLRKREEKSNFNEVPNLKIPKDLPPLYPGPPKWLSKRELIPSKYKVMEMFLFNFENQREMDTRWTLLKNIYS